MIVTDLACSYRAMSGEDALPLHSQEQRDGCRVVVAVVGEQEEAQGKEKEEWQKVYKGEHPKKLQEGGGPWCLSSNAIGRSHCV